MPNRPDRRRSSSCADSSALAAGGSATLRSGSKAAWSMSTRKRTTNRLGRTTSSPWPHAGSCARARPCSVAWPLAELTCLRYALTATPCPGSLGLALSAPVFQPGKRQAPAARAVKARLHSSQLALLLQSRARALVLPLTRLRSALVWAESEPVQHQKWRLGTPLHVSKLVRWCAHRSLPSPCDDRSIPGLCPAPLLVRCPAAPHDLLTPLTGPF